MSADEPTCCECKLPASQIEEYVMEADAEGITPAQAARDDGTYNPVSNRFACTRCYIAMGMPSGPGGWKAP